MWATLKIRGPRIIVNCSIPCSFTFPVYRHLYAAKRNRKRVAIGVYFVCASRDSEIAIYARNTVHTVNRGQPKVFVVSFERCAASASSYPLRKFRSCTSVSRQGHVTTYSRRGWWTRNSAACSITCDARNCGYVLVCRTRNLGERSLRLSKICAGSWQFLCLKQAFSRGCSNKSGWLSAGL